MSPEEKALIDKLAVKIQKEYDPEKIETLAAELMRLLTKRKSERDDESVREEVL